MKTTNSLHLENINQEELPIEVIKIQERKKFWHRFKGIFTNAEEDLKAWGKLESKKAQGKSFEIERKLF